MKASLVYISEFQDRQTELSNETQSWKEGTEQVSMIIHTCNPSNCEDKAKGLQLLGQLELTVRLSQGRTKKCYWLELIQQ